MFDLMDKNKDGFISFEDAKECLTGKFKDFKSAIGTNPQWEEIFNSLDADGDGMLDYHEFIQAATNRTALLNETNLKKAFSILDKDGNGKLCSHELQETFAACNFHSHGG